MKRRLARRAMSYLLLGVGGFFLFLGGRYLVEERLGQVESARVFVEEEPAQPALPAPARTGGVLARMTIPRLHTELYVMEGDGTRELRRGPGHMAGSAMPGGQGNCIIAGHRDTHFRILKEVRRGDAIILETGGRAFVYTVRSVRVVSPASTGALAETATPELNLITCYPFEYVGSAPDRFVVNARLEESEAEVSAAAKTGRRKRLPHQTGSGEPNRQWREAAGVE